MQRYQQEIIEKDLSKKIVFIVGPRQVGKTWLSKEIAKKFKNPLYLNYDNSKDREIIINESWLDNTDLIIFDEIHKMKNWKNYIKGVFDTKLSQLKILITGSARLNTFQQSGDSMAGRYFLHNLLPFSLKELNYVGGDSISAQDNSSSSSENQDISVLQNKLINLGGFPEPLLSNEIKEAKRWRKLYINGLIREDILNFENIRNLKAINLLFELLRERTASPISYNSLARDLDTSANTIKKYIEILESLYIIFRVTPYSKNIARSILKEPKIYFYDTGLVKGDDGIIFENYVGVSLLKDCLYKNDVEGENYNLSYLRTKDGKEVDFALVNENKIVELIEVKHKKSDIPKNLKYFCDKYNLKGVLLVKELKREYKVENIEVRLSTNYLSEN